MPKANEGTLKLKDKAEQDDEQENIDEGDDTQEEEEDEGAGGDSEGSDSDEGEEGSGEGADDIDEAKLRKLGWVPKAEWKGDPNNWMDPETFNKKRGDELSQLRLQNREMQRTLDDFKEYNRTREERAYKRAMKDLKARKMAAVKDGDEEAYQEIEAEESELKKDFEAEPAKKAPPKKDEVEVPPEVDEWVSANPWFDTDVELADAARIYHGTLGKRHPDKPLSELLKMTSEHIKKVFPEKFTESPGKRRSPLERGRNSTFKPGGGKQKTAADLPEEAREAGKRFIRQGLFKDMNEYAVDYWKE
jgi:hypothetical protein